MTHTPPVSHAVRRCTGNGNPPPLSTSKHITHAYPSQTRQSTEHEREHVTVNNDPLPPMYQQHRKQHSFEHTTGGTQQHCPQQTTHISTKQTAHHSTQQHRLTPTHALRTSSSKPRSSMRSPSSSTKYLQMSMLIRFLFRWSFSLPGVATMQCRPRRL
jgi:hypothetical protein